MGCGCKKRNTEETTEPTPLTIKITEPQTPSPTALAPVVEQPQSQENNQ